MKPYLVWLKVFASLVETIFLDLQHDMAITSKDNNT